MEINYNVEMIPSEMTRRITWNGQEVATMNMRGDLTDETESGIAAAFACSPCWHQTLTIIAQGDGPDAARAKEALAKFKAILTISDSYVCAPVEDDDQDPSETHDNREAFYE